MVAPVTQTPAGGQGASDGGPRLILAVVDRGEADRVVGAAIRAGAQAATVFIGRSISAQAHVGESGLAIQEEKEVIVTVVGADIADNVTHAMMEGSSASGDNENYVAKMPVARVVGLLEAVAMQSGTDPASAS